MSRKRHGPEQNIAKLREADAMLGQVVRPDAKATPAWIAPKSPTTGDVAFAVVHREEVRGVGYPRSYSLRGKKHQRSC